MEDFVYNGCGHVGTLAPIHGADDKVEYCSEHCRQWFEGDVKDEDPA
jgi:hypothetical protein